MPKKNSIRFVYVEWIDSHTFGGWKNVIRHVEDAEEDTLLCKSVGLLLKKKKDRIIICQSVSTPNGTDIDNVTEILTIPAISIKKLKYLQYKRGKKNGSS